MKGEWYFFSARAAELSEPDNSSHTSTKSTQTIAKSYQRRQAPKISQARISNHVALKIIGIQVG